MGDGSGVFRKPWTVYEAGQRDRRNALLVATAANPLTTPLDSAWQSGSLYWHLYRTPARTPPWRPQQPRRLALPAAAGGIVVDSSSQTTFTQSTVANAALASAAFSPPANSVILVAFPDENNNATADNTASITDSLGSHLTWTKIVTENNSNPSGSTNIANTLFWAPCPNAQVGMTVTVTPSGVTSSDRGVAVAVLTGADMVNPIGATGVGIGTANPQNISYTSTVIGSMGFLCGLQAFGAVTTSAGTGTTMQAILSPTASSNEYLFARQTVACTSIATQTIQLNFSGAPNTGWCYVEILPASGAAAIPRTPPVQSSWLRDFGQIAWLQQRDRRDANTVATAANPPLSPLDSAWQAGATYWHLYNDQRRGLGTAYWGQRAALAAPDVVLADIPAGPLAKAPYVDRRAVPQQRTYTDVSLLSTALLEGELLDPQPERRASPATNAARWWMPQQPDRESNPDLLTQALLEGPQLYADPRRLAINPTRPWTPQRLAAPAAIDQPAVADVPFAGVRLPQTVPVPRPGQRQYFDPTLLATALAESPQLNPGPRVLPPQPPARPAQRTYTDPALLGSALLEAELLGGAETAKRNLPATNVDRREVPQQRAYISDPSTYPTTAPTDPLTLAWGTGGHYWLMYNSPAVTVDRRLVPAQRRYLSDPGLLLTALLEIPPGPDRQMARALFVQRLGSPAARVLADLSVAADPTQLLGDLLRRLNTPLTHADRREVPTQLRRGWPVLVDLSRGGGGAPYISSSAERGTAASSAAATTSSSARGRDRRTTGGRW